MNRTILSMLLIAAALATVAVAARQPSAEDERRAAITLMRAINTGENAVASKNGGKYVSLLELIEHSAMTRVRPNITVSGNTFTHQGAQIRLALSADATQYIVTSVSPSGVAAFTDERGVIYTGESLK
jgi:hypothetical protein